MNQSRFFYFSMGQVSDTADIHLLETIDTELSSGFMWNPVTTSVSVEILSGHKSWGYRRRTHTQKCKNHYILLKSSSKFLGI